MTWIMAGDKNSQTEDFYPGPRSGAIYLAQEVSRRRPHGLRLNINGKLSYMLPALSIDIRMSRVPGCGEAHCKVSASVWNPGSTGSSLPDEVPLAHRYNLGPQTAWKMLH